MSVVGRIVSFHKSFCIRFVETSPNTDSLSRQATIRVTSHERHGVWKHRQTNYFFTSVFSLTANKKAKTCLLDPMCGKSIGQRFPGEDVITTQCMIHTLTVPIRKQFFSSCITAIKTILWSSYQTLIFLGKQPIFRLFISDGVGAVVSFMQCEVPFQTGANVPHRWPCCNLLGT